MITTFVDWLESHPADGILPSQVMAARNILDRLPVQDLLVVVLEADEEVSVRALRELRKRWEYRQYAGQQMQAAWEESCV